MILAVECRDTHARKSNPPGDASENLALAAVLATSKLLGMMENNEETREKQPRPVSKQQQLLLVGGRRIPRGLPKRGRRRCAVGELEQGNDGICLLAVDAGAHVSEPASRPSQWHDARVKYYSRSCVFPQRPAGPLATQ